MKKKPVIITFVVVLGILLVLYGLTFVESRGERVQKDCLFKYVSKCGSVAMTEDEILRELNDLRNYYGISKRKSRELFLDAQKKNQGYLDGGYDSMQDITDEERERMRGLSREEAFYFERALRAVERMGDSPWWAL